MSRTIKALMPFIQQYISFLWLSTVEEDAHFVAEKPTDGNTIDSSYWDIYENKLGKKVVWTPVSGVLPVKPELPYIALNVYNQHEEAQEQLSFNGTHTESRVPTTAILNLQMMGNRDKDPVDVLEVIRRKIALPNWVDVAYANGLAIYDSGPVLDIAAVIDGVQWEPRAELELNIRFDSVVSEKTYSIEHVHVQGAVEDKFVEIFADLKKG